MRFLSNFRLLGLVGIALFCVACAKEPASTDQSASTTTEETTSAEADSEEADEVAKAMAELPDAERAVAIAQKYCPVSAMEGGDSLLGSMGKPYKVTLDGKDVYLCCEGCVTTAEEDPAATLAKVEELKQRAANER